jgi:hypothetical protein
MSKVIKLLKEKGVAAAEELSNLVSHEIEIIEELIDAIYNNDNKVKVGAIKTLLLISQKRPSLLYDYFDLFYKLLDSPDNALKWNAIDILANFADIDKDDRINEEVIAKFFELLHDESLITAGHSIDNLWKLALNKPQFESDITQNLLRLENMIHNNEDKNVHIGKALVSLSHYFIYSNHKRDIIDFAEKSLNNPKNSIKNKAQKYFNKWNKDNPNKEQ